MKKLACGLVAMALFGLLAETVTIDLGVGAIRIAGGGTMVIMH